jgi:hypothetical protein
MQPVAYIDDCCDSDHTGNIYKRFFIKWFFNIPSKFTWFSGCAEIVVYLLWIYKVIRLPARSRHIIGLLLRGFQVNLSFGQ